LRRFFFRGIAAIYKGYIMSAKTKGMLKSIALVLGVIIVDNKLGISHKIALKLGL